MTQSDLVAPSWTRWIGIPFAMLAALVLALDTAGKTRVSGLLLCLAAAMAWAIAVATGSIRVRRRDQQSYPVQALIIVTVVLGPVIVALLPHHVPHGDVLAGFAELLATELLSMAIAFSAYRLWRQLRG